MKIFLPKKANLAQTFIQNLMCKRKMFKKAFSQLLFLFGTCLFFQSCITFQSKPILLNKSFKDSSLPPPPDYSKAENWAALPTKKDPADQVPENSLKDEQATALADVFFVYPTIYTYKPTGNNLWNADVNDAYLNKKIDEGTILNQASVFNASGKIYAPLYRQAHISAYWTQNKEDAAQAFVIAYEDVKTAFEYYLKNYNQGRPIIIASHSQGSQHATQLLKDYFDNKPLYKQLVAAYLVGMPPDLKFGFQVIKPCGDATQTNCYISWRTYARDYFPRNHEKNLKFSVSTNPLTWKIDESYAPRDLHKGGVARGFAPSGAKTVDAQNYQGMLWINKPNIRGKAFLRVKNWHIADYNLFYYNIRENAKERVKAFLTNMNRQ